MHCIGVTYDRTSAKMASISFRRGKVHVSDLSTLPTEEHLLQELNGKTKAVTAFAIDERKALIKKVKVPSVSQRVLKKTLPFQLETVFALPPDGFFFHPFHSKKNVMHVAAVAKRDVEYIISQYDPHAITTEQTALLHFANTFCPDRESLCICHAAKGLLKVVLMDKGSYSKSATFSIQALHARNSFLDFLSMKKKKPPFLFLGEKEGREQVIKLLRDGAYEFQEYALSLPESHVEYALEIGIALEACVPRSDSIQMRSGPYVHECVKKKRWRVVYTTAFSLFMLACGLHWYLDQEYAEVENRVAIDVTRVLTASPHLFRGIDKYHGIHAKVNAMEERVRRAPLKKRFIDISPRCGEALSLLTAQCAKDGIPLLDFQYTLQKYPTVSRAKEKYQGNIVCKLGDTDPITVKKAVQALKKRVFFKDADITVRREEHGYSLDCTFTQ